MVLHDDPIVEVADTVPEPGHDCAVHNSKDSANASKTTKSIACRFLSRGRRKEKQVKKMDSETIRRTRSRTMTDN